MLARVDYAVAAIEIVDADADDLPTPGHAPARLTTEGYLLCDALIARDGVLEYADGKDRWLEYRPRSELERAANGWIGLPFTDGHPSRMVDAKTWTKVARGTHVTVFGLVDISGTAYLHARILITDAALVAECEKQYEAGKPVQLSIGFLSEVHDEPGTHLGFEYKYTQRNLIPNHTAKVPAGRAGPACRVLFDGIDCATYDQGADAHAEDPAMTIKNEKPKSDKASGDVIGTVAYDLVLRERKADEAGAPGGMVSVPHPVTGQPIEVDPAIAAALSELAALKAGAPAAPAAPAPSPAAPLGPGANAAPPAPAPAPAAAGAPLEKPEDRKEMSQPEDRKESMSDLVKARRKLERDAQTCGVAADKLDVDDVDLKRAIVLARMPHAKVDKLDGAPLDALVETALAQPQAASSGPSRPWGLDAAKSSTATKNDEKSAAPSGLAAYLQAQGY